MKVSKVWGSDEAQPGPAVGEQGLDYAFFFFFSQNASRRRSQVFDEALKYHRHNTGEVLQFCLSLVSV